MSTNNKIKILLVDDDQQVMSLYRRVAERLGLEPLLAYDIYQALNLMEDADILILDLKLPNGDSSIVVEKWQASNRGRPMAIVSGYITADVMQDMYLRGAWNVLKKPVPLTTFERVLQSYRRHVRWQRTAMAIEARLTALEQKYSRAKRLNYALMVILAAVLGERILPTLLKLL